MTAPDHIGEITERAGEAVTSEQVLRNYSRYAWARQYCKGKRVLEIACGTGQGLGMLIEVAQSAIAVDVDAMHVDGVRNRYGRRVTPVLAAPSALPFSPGSADVVIILEALYFFPDPDAAIREALRVMTRPGLLLLSFPNKDIGGFTPSPYGTKYFGGPDLKHYLESFGLKVSLFGDCPVESGIGERARVFLKSAATNLGLFPHSMRAKTMLKKVFFGGLRRMPDVFAYGSYDVAAPVPLSADQPTVDRKILLAHASMS